MPMVIPLIAAFAAGAGGVAALGAAAAIGGTLGTIATIAAYATIAGAVLTGVGALTGSKDLMKIGAVLSIAGGIGSLGAGIASAAGTSAASSGMDLAADAAAGTGNNIATAGEALGGATPAAGNVAGAAAATVDGAALPNVTTPTAPPTPDALSTGYQQNLAASTPGASAPNATAGTPSGMGDYGSSLGRGAAGTTETTVADTSTQALNRIAEGAKGINSSDVSSWWERAQRAGGAVGDFIKNNPALVKIGGDMLSSSFGPAAERLDLEKSIMERARRNLNAPVALTYTKPGG